MPDLKSTAGTGDGDASRSLLPDTRNFLAIAIVFIVAGVVFVLMLHPIDLNDKTFGALTMLLGVLIGSFKDVYSYSFGTTKDSGEKNKILADQSVALAAATPPAPSTTITTVKVP